MRKSLALFFILITGALLVAPCAAAQTPTTVTATVTDPSGIPYAGGTVKATIAPPGVSSPCVVVNSNCVPIPGTVGPASLDSTGSFTMNLYPNASIVPAATQWTFTVCIAPGVSPPFGTGPQCFSSTATIAGASQSLSSTLSALAPALTHSAASGAQPTVVVDGVTVTTVAQALAQLPSTGGTIDARTCTPGSLALGTFDVGSKAVALLLGSCTYTFTAIVEESQLQIFGIGSDGSSTLSYTGPSNSFFFPANTNGNDLTSMVLTGFAVVNSGSSTNIGCMNVNPLQVNTSAEQNYIYNVLFYTVEVSPPACITLHGTGAVLAGENEVNGFVITDNTFFWPTTPISILGSVSSVVISANITDNSSVAVSCNATGGIALGISIVANSFFMAPNPPISNTGCGITTSANVVGTGSAALDTINGNQIVAQTGSITSGHLASWNANGKIQDGGVVPQATTAILSSATTTLGADVALTVNVNTNILTNSVTMPASGCPCRVLISYGMLWTSNNSTIASLVTDGTNTMASAQQTGNGTNTGGQRATQISPVTYANNAAVTFTLQAEANGTGNTIKAAPAIEGQNTWLSATVITSQ